MFGGNNSNPALPVFLEENHFPYQRNVSNQLQLFESVPPGCSIDPLNLVRNEYVAPVLPPNKRARETENIPMQRKLQFSLNYKDVADRSANIPNPNPVSTGLRLSYEDEHNSFVTSASGKRTSLSSIMLSLSHNVRTELDRQKEEFEHYIKIQKENLSKGVTELKQKHTASFLESIEKNVINKLREKDQEIDHINRRNNELLKNIKQVATEAQNWQYRAKYNESVVYALNNNLQNAFSHIHPDQWKEGIGESKVDDATSYFNTNNNTNNTSRTLQAIKEHRTCRACNENEVCVLLMPCRHLCLCKECNLLVRVCPVCHSFKTASLQVLLS